VKAVMLVLLLEGGLGGWRQDVMLVEVLVEVLVQ
jgi:hypothetical protein